MKFFFPDSQDQVDPYFDFLTETTSEFRVRQRDDLYAHEALTAPAYDGLLVSKPIIDGLAGTSGKYTMAQRHRLYRLGIRRFFRLDQAGWNIVTMGDCGGFTYVREEVPPYAVSEVVEFYEGCGFDYGISVDHVILGWDPSDMSAELPEWVRRQRLTLELARDFLDVHARRNCSFYPLGAAQGWSPTSYAESVAELQAMGYDYIALGGMVPLKTHQILQCLEAVAGVLADGVRLHLLGISRTASAEAFGRFGVVSFDSTTPFRQAFKDDTDNYYWWDRNFVAIRVPQIDGNTSLKSVIRAGRIDQGTARRLERNCLTRLRAFDRGEESASAVVEALAEYGQLHGAPKDRSSQYAEFLTAAPWKKCRCGICERVGIEVAIFRGTERNKRRGFHNLHVFSERIRSAARPSPSIQVGHH